MCVIINKRRGIELLDKDTLRSAFIHNPDGAGIAWTDGTPEHPKKIKLRKGFMDFNSLWEFLEKLKKIYGNNLKDLSMIIHCRITTHGQTNAENTHPFPLSNDIEDLQAIRLNNLDTVIAHNGVVGSVYIPATSTLSDTMVFIKNQLYPIAELNNEWYRSERMLKALHEIITSKLSILNSKGEIFTVGGFHNRYDGLEYSNLHFENMYYQYNYRHNDYRFLNDDMDDDLLNLSLSEYIELTGQEVYDKLYNKETTTWKMKAAYLFSLKDNKDFYLFDTIDGVCAYVKEKNEYDVLTVKEFLDKYKDHIFEVELELYEDMKETCGICKQ